MNTKFQFIALATCLFLFNACKKPDFNKTKGVQWNPNLAVPVGYSEFDVYDILAGQDQNSLVSISSIGELALNYRGELLSVGANQIAQLDNQTASINLSLANQGLSGVGSFNSSVTQTTNQTITFNLANGVKLNTLALEGGSIDFSIQSDLQHNIVVSVLFPDILINGQPVVRSLSSNYSGPPPHGNSTSIDLTGAQFDLTAGGTASENTLRAQITTTVNGTGNAIIGNENTTVIFGFNNLQLDHALGYFGQQALINATDSIQLKLFDNIPSGFVQLTNPKLRFNITNTFGMPVQLDVSNLKTINANTNATTNLTTNVLSGVVIPGAANQGDSVIVNLTELNTNNTTNMNALVNNTPKYLSYTANAISNPNGVAPNFVTKNSQLKIDADLELPLEGFAYDFEIRDTMPFNFSENADMVDYVLFRINATNGFPISFVSQVQFLDQNYMPIFSIFSSEETILAAAPVNSNGIVTTPVKKITDIQLDQNKIGLLSTAKYAVIVGKAATTQPNTAVKIMDSYKLLLKLGIQVKLKLGA